MRILAILTLAPVVRGTPAPTPAPTPTPWDGSCDTLTNIVVGGQDFTDVTKTVCNVWGRVPQLGQFPGQSVEHLTGIMNVAFEEGGLWDQLKAKFSAYNDDYCLRADATRIVISHTASENTCPGTLDMEVLEEYPELFDTNQTIDAQALLTGNWACAKKDGTSCSCSQRDVKMGANPNPVVSIASRPSGCEMVSGGKCYGPCPDGYRPTFLTGYFRPSCTSVCGATNHPVTCGPGCAASRTACVGVILNMVKEVAIAASKVASFLAAGPGALLIAQTVEQVIKIAEFGFNVLIKVLDVVDFAYKTFTREEAELATAVAIFQVLKEVGAEIAQDWLEFQPVVSTSGALFLSLIDAEFGWKEINLGWIANSIVQYGNEALTAGFRVASAFAYRKCELATDEVAFTVENVGDTRMIGPWTQDGNSNGKARYRNLNPSLRADTMMEWNSRMNSWSFWIKDKSFGRGWWFGWAGFGWRELYESRSPTPNFPTSGWRRIEGALPLPTPVGTKNNR